MQSDSLSNDIDLKNFKYKDIPVIIAGLGKQRAATVFNRDLKVIEEWYSMKDKEISVQDLKDIYSKMDAYILQDFKDCPGLALLQSLLVPEPENGDYSPYLDKLIYQPSEFKIRSFYKERNCFHDFDILVLRMLKNRKFVSMQLVNSDTYKVSLTKKGVGYLIRDRLNQRREFYEPDDENIDKYVTQINFSEVF